MSPSGQERRFRQWPVTSGFAPNINRTANIAAVAAIKEKGVLSGERIERAEVGTAGEFMR
jgi:hypothetical protein